MAELLDGSIVLSLDEAKALVTEYLNMNYGMVLDGFKILQQINDLIEQTTK